MKKITVLAAALTGILAVAATPTWAQSAPRGDARAPAATTPAPRPNVDLSSLHAIDKDTKNVTYNGLTVDKLHDTNIETASGKKVGEIDQVLVNSDNKIVAVSVDAGGFLGIGGEKVVMSLDQLQYDGQKKKFITSMNEDQLKSMPKWDNKKR
jgi:hypothetical protein